ncbi:hypothetical protein ACPA9J_23250 [Pseudomonas aeruginosa]
MSHEIRTPMNAVIGILELVLQRSGAGAARTRLAGGRLRGCGVAATAHRRHPRRRQDRSPAT